jgi:hypothetical protein
LRPARVAEEEKVVNWGKAKLSASVETEAAARQADVPAYGQQSLLQRFKSRLLGARAH